MDDWANKKTNMYDYQKWLFNDPMMCEMYTKEFPEHSKPTNFDDWMYAV